MSQGSSLLENAPGRLSGPISVALDADADTELYTVPPGFRCVLVFAIGVVDGDPNTTDLSIGANGAETDFIPASDLNLLSAANDACVFQPIPAANVLLLKSYAAGTVIEAKITNQAGAVGKIIEIYLFGVLFPV